ncbi:Uncharacterised protein [Bordetella pertussis]|nr:Uncharacterised protein [Bordetella pertussis]
MVATLSAPHALARSACRLEPGRVQSGSWTKAAVGATSLLSSVCVRPGRMRAMASGLVPTTRSPASTRSASPMATRVLSSSPGVGASTTCEYTAPPFPTPAMNTP